MRCFGFLFVCFVSLFSVLSAAQVWRNGSLFVSSPVEGLTLQRFGGKAYDSSALPGYFPGMVRMSGSAREGLYWCASNAVVGAYYGLGDFNIERFEQDSMDAATARSRMILSMATGRLILDSRELAAETQLLIELPMGKVHIKRALISLEIRLDERSQIYDFRMICAEGSLRFKSHQGEQFYANETQLLSGVGSSYAPTIEVSEVTNRMRDSFTLFETRANRVSAEAAEDPLGFSRHMDSISSTLQLGEQSSKPVSEPADRSQERRPIIIEFVPAPKPLVPFRGEVRPLSEREADLF